MTEVILHLGTNVGFKEINLELARIMISNHIGPLQRLSSIYETEAWGGVEQESFLNQAVSVTSLLSVREVLSSIQLIEAKMGRQREQHWGPRIIDIDILFYGDDIVDIPDLKIPHRELSKRNFVLQPLLELCPDKVHPELGKSIRQLAEACEDSLAVQKRE